MKDLDQKIIELMDLFDDEQVTTADKIDRPERALEKEAIDDFMKRNPMAGGGMLVQPGFGGTRQGYKEQTFISGPGTGVSALDDPKKYKIVKKYLNKVKTQKNKRIFLDWSEQIGAKPNPWYTKLKKEVKLTRQPLNELINKVISEEFPTAYSGKAGKAQYAREMTVKSFINYWNQNGMFDGNEKLAKPLEQFVTSKKGTPNSYENINRYFTEWRDGKFEVDGVDRKNLDKGLLQAINKWNPSNKSKRSVGVKQQLIYLNNLSPNLSYDRVANLFAQKFPDNAQTLQHRLNQLTELKRNGVYNDGTGNPKKIPGIKIGERSGWLKEGYGKGFLGNYGRLVKRADELMAAGETKFAKRLYNAADKFFSPTGIFTKAAGEGEHPLSRNMGDGPIGNQLKINSLVSGDLNQFKKFNFDSPVRNLVLEYENPNTTSARKKEIKLEIENRKKLMNILTEGPNQKGIVDSVKFNYGSNKITASVDVPDIDKIKNFDINEFITRGEDYRTSVLQKGKDVGLIDKKGQIIKQTFDQNEIQKILASFGDGTCAVTFGKKGKRDGGRIGYQTGTPGLNQCIESGIKNFNDGKLKTADQVQDAAKLLRGGRAVVSGLMKYGIVPELAYVGLEAAGRTILGEKPTNALLKSIDTLTFGATDFTSNIEAEKFGKFGDLKLDVDKYRNSLAKVNSIQQDIANLETLNTGSQFGYEGDQTEAIQMKKAQLQAAEQELQKNTVSSDKVQFIDRKAEEIADAQMAKSAFAKQSLKDQMDGIPGVADYMDTETARMFPKQPSQTELNLNMLPSFQDALKTDQAKVDRTIMNAPDEVLQSIAPDALEIKKALQEAYKMENLKDTFGAEQIYGTQGVFSQPLQKGGRAGFKLGSVRKGIQALIDEGVKKTPKDTTSALDKLIKETLDKDFFDKKDRIIDQLDITAAKKRKNFPYNQKVQEEPDQLEFYDDITKSNFRTKTGPFFDRRKRAGGGILKQAGDSSGPPPESGPNSQGLQGLMKRGIKT